MYRSEDNVLEFVLSYYVDYKNQIRVFSLGRMHFYRLSHLVKNLFLVFNIYILQTIDISPNYLHYCYFSCHFDMVIHIQMWARYF